MWFIQLPAFVLPKFLSRLVLGRYLTMMAPSKWCTLNSHKHELAGCINAGNASFSGAARWLSSVLWHRQPVQAVSGERRNPQAPTPTPRFVFYAHWDLRSSNVLKIHKIFSSRCSSSVQCSVQVHKVLEEGEKGAGWTTLKMSLFKVWILKVGLIWVNFFFILLRAFDAKGPQ